MPRAESDPELNECSLFGYGFCVLCGHCVAEDFLKLFYGYCADCILANAPDALGQRSLLIDGAKVVIERASVVDEIRAEADARWSSTIPVDYATKHGVAPFVARAHPAEAAAWRALVRIAKGYPPFRQCDVGTVVTARAIETIRHWLLYGLPHGCAPPEPREGQR